MTFVRATRTSATCNCLRRGGRRASRRLVAWFPEFWYGWRQQIQPLAAAGFRARLYWEKTRDFLDAKEITIPLAITVFPDELYQAPKIWAQRAYPNNLLYFNSVDRGGHFAAWEEPALFSAELRAAFQSFAVGQ